jgi:hypothetical protein
LSPVGRSSTTRVYAPLIDEEAAFDLHPYLKIL